MVQAMMRGHLSHRSVRQALRSVIRIQAAARGLRSRRSMGASRIAIITMQAMWRRGNAAPCEREADRDRAPSATTPGVEETPRLPCPASARLTYPTSRGTVM